MSVHVKHFWRKTGFGLLIAAILAPLVSQGIALAASNEGPIHVDNDGTTLITNYTGYGNPAPTGRYWDYVVSNDDFTDIFETDVLIYTPDPTPAIQIIGKDLCMQGSASIRDGDVHYVAGSSTTATEYRVYTNDGTTAIGTSVDYDRGFWTDTSATDCRDNTITLSGYGSPYNDDIGMYVYRVNARANYATGGKFVNAFHVVAPAGSIVTQSSRAPFSDFGLQAAYPAPSSAAAYYSTIDIPFGPDCTMTTETSTRYIDLIDPDNGDPTQPDVQPRTMGLVVYKYNRASGAYLGTVPLTPVSIGSGYSVYEGNNVWSPRGANQTGVRYSFTADKDEIYKVRFARVYYNNTLQFRLPFDGGYYYRQCRTSVRPIASMTPTGGVENGQTVSAGARIAVNGATPYNSRVQYNRYVWGDRNRDGNWDSGEPYFCGTPHSAIVLVPPSGLDIGNCNLTVDTGTMGGRLCTTLSLSQASGENVQFTSNPSGPVCVDIGKKPKMHVQHGDVMVGGTFRNGSGVCALQGVGTTTLNLLSSLSTVGGVDYTSLTDYGANNLGIITYFGTNGLTGTNPLATSLRFGNYPAPAGFFYSPGSGPTAPAQPRCLDDPFTAFGSQGPFYESDQFLLGINVPLTGSNIKYTGTGELRVGASVPLPPGMRRIIYAPTASQVTIVSDITYADGPYNSVADIPQLVVITGGRIVVQGGVNRLDGIYGSRNAFYTCPDTPLLSRCTEQLTVNGMVITANQVRPYRTFGAQAPNHGDKAEIFRLHPSVLLNQAPGAVGGNNTSIRTVEQREVPPRF
jgi:hypothetical protein